MSVFVVTTEKSVQASVLEWLNTVPGVKAWRQNTGAQTFEYKSRRTGLTKKRFIRFGEPGQGDVTGIGPHGVRIEIEIKRPGKYPDFYQRSWMGFINDHGGIAFWADSLRSAVEQLRAEFQKRGWKWSETWSVK
jgi:hypothetical protein